MKTQLRKLSMLAVSIVVSVDAMAYDVEVDGLYYNIVEDVWAEVAQSPGASPNDSYSGDIVIPSEVVANGITYPVKGIGEAAFLNSIDISSVTIPNSVMYINSSAFAGCTGLIHISIPNSVTNISPSVFQNCTGLISVYISNSVTRICRNAFFGCMNLTSVSIPNSVVSIEEGAFQGCIGLSSITLPASLSVIDCFAFSGCSNLKDIIMLCKTITAESCGKKVDKLFLPINDIYEVEHIYIYPHLYDRFENKDNLVVCGAPFYTIKSVNSIKQSTVSLTLQASGYSPVPSEMEELSVEEYGAYCNYNYYNGESDGNVTITGLRPNASYTVSAYTKYDDGTTVLTSDSHKFTLKGLSPYITSVDVSPTSASLIGKYTLLDATVKNTVFKCNGESYPCGPSGEFTFTGLTPKKSYSISFMVDTNEGSTETATYSFNTTKLEFTNEVPKVVNSGTAIVCASTNISDVEPNVGFEWRKTDAPDVVVSKSGAGVIYDGVLEGLIWTDVSCFFNDYPQRNHHISFRFAQSFPLS